MTRRLRAVVVDDEPLARERIETLLAEAGDIEVVQACGDGARAVEAVRANQPDLLFLDIQMPEMDGFAVLEALSPVPLPTVVFVTAHDDHALRAFDMHAVDYILKPINPERFRTALARARQRVGREAMRFVVRQAGRLHLVRADEIDWIEAAGNYARLHVGGRAHLIRATIASLADRLDRATFLRIHRSTIVNLDRVTTVAPHAHGEYVVLMQDGARLTSSRSYSAGLRRQLR